MLDDLKKGVELWVVEGVGVYRFLRMRFWIGGLMMVEFELHR